MQTWPALGRDAVRHLIQSQAIFVCGKLALKAGQYLSPGDEVQVHSLPESFVGTPETAEDVSAISPYAFLDLPVVYEDEALLVVDKVAGMALSPSTKIPQGTLMQLLIRQYPDIAHIGGVERAGVVTRLVADASGLMLIAKHETAYRTLRRAAKRQRIERAYSALVEGRLTGEHTIDQPIGNVKRARERLAVAREGRPACTVCRGLRQYKDGTVVYSLLDVRPDTARLHQMRVHLSWYGFPIVGDRLYGSRQQPILSERLFLHLGMLTFPHPVTGELTVIESALPVELQSILRYLARPKK